MRRETFFEFTSPETTRTLRAVSTRPGHVRVFYGIVELPSEASPEIFIAARAALGLPEAEVVPLT